MGDVLNSFFKLRGLIPDDKKDKKETKNKNKEYTQELENKKHSSMINKIIDEKPACKFIIKYFQARLKELDEQEEEND